MVDKQWYWTCSCSPEYVPDIYQKYLSNLLTVYSIDINQTIAIVCSQLIRKHNEVQLHATSGYIIVSVLASKISCNLKPPLT